jgi:cell wall-associated NlpC family hydrolase
MANRENLQPDTSSPFATRHSLFAASESEQRAAVVAEARSWIRTPYQHAADRRRGGVDCAMLLVRVFVDTGLVASFDPRPYSRTWFLHRDEPLYLGIVQRYAREIFTPPQPGDIAMFKIARQYAHAGVVTQWPKLVHAFAQARMVLEDNAGLQGKFEAVDKRFFSYWAPRPSGAAARPPQDDAGSACHPLNSSC